MRLSAFIQLMIRESQERAVVPESKFRLQYVLYICTYRYEYMCGECQIQGQ